jgi:hypothetical protein
VAPPPKRRGGGRVTAKGTQPNVGGRTAARARGNDDVMRANEVSSRYTPPIPKYEKMSPPWVPVLMFVLLGVGSLLIIVNYLGILPGGTENWYLVVGLALILGGIGVATQYH